MNMSWGHKPETKEKRITVYIILKSNEYRGIVTLKEVAEKFKREGYEVLEDYIIIDEEV
ncbi:hypothetical protein [Thermoanaerobacter sp. YS13]|uniref:hypothetical protein n=1 Tax=Thermoanaerobacter sp. YS13 TaxID=1511746 RepID=UPI000A6AAEBC|nr:hypothetical protein [Thermoanaerobacter sp. YS13]